MLEHTFTCPYCWETLTEQVDPVQGTHEYTVDCWVCCRPIQIRATVQNGQIVAFDAQPASGHR